MDQMLMLDYAAMEVKNMRLKFMIKIRSMNQKKGRGLC